MNLRRSAGLSVANGVVAGYIHNKLADDLGKIGVLVALESDGDAGKLVDEVDAAALDRERDVLSEQARASGKPEEIIAKMVEGRLRKFYEEVVLLEQVFVMDTDRKIAKVVEEAAKDIGAPVKLGGFVRFELGEGVEKAAGED